MELKPTDWAEIISAIGTMIAAIVAVIAAFQSYRSAKQNNDTNEQMIRPRLAVYVESTEVVKSFIDIVVLNEGGGLARDICFSIKGEDLELNCQSEGIDKLSKLRVIKHGITMLPSKNKRRYFILSAVGCYKKLLKNKTEVGVHYTDITGKKKYSDSFLLDFASLSDSSWTTDKDEAFKVISNELPKISKGLNFIKIIGTFNSE
ncbi:MAG: hypothetical protein ACFNZO_02555 [Candidatus Saccharibacteria bacterium]